LSPQIRPRNYTLYSNPDPHEDMRHTRKNTQVNKKITEESLNIKDFYGQSAIINRKMSEL